MNGRDGVTGDDDCPHYNSSDKIGGVYRDKM